MSRCVICDIETGAMNLTAPYIKRNRTPGVRWRERYNEYQCDDCYDSIKDVKKILDANFKRSESGKQRKV